MLIKTRKKSSSATSSAPTVALVGNPNTGKTSVFNMLTGAHHRVGNYPGVTVETVTSRMQHTQKKLDMVDLPGTYSLAARSLDEMLVIDCLLGRLPETPRPNAVVVVVDASNIDRNLFLVLQVLETGVPAIVALNMIDVAERNRMEIDADRLSEHLKVPVVPMSARSGRGRSELVAAIENAVESEGTEAPSFLPEPVAAEVRRFEASVASVVAPAPLPDAYELKRCLFDVGGYTEKRLVERYNGGLEHQLATSRRRLEDAGWNVPSMEAELAYRWIEDCKCACVCWQAPDRKRVSDRIDDFLTHRVLGTGIFLVVFGAIFISVFMGGAWVMDKIGSVFSWLQEAVTHAMGPGVLTSLVADGLIVGVGGVVVFLPQILILFALITILEDCGYLARAAFLMDRLFRSVGLGGRSFVPLMSSFACAIPGVMAARTIDNPRVRLQTILVAPLMSCSARIPVYVLFIAVFIPNKIVLGFLPLQGLVFGAMYLVGIFAAAIAAFVFRHLLFKGEESPFILELPYYKTPSIKTVLLRLYDRGKDFLFTAGTIILAMSVIIWALLYFPRPASLATEVRAEQEARIASNLAEAGVIDPGEIEAAVAEQDEHIEQAIAGAYVRQSYLGRVGHAMEPVFKPLGWDWKIGMSVMAAFPAREVIISTLGIVYNLGADVDQESPELEDQIRNATTPEGERVYSLPVAFSIMVFFALCAQCQATLAVIKRETNSWRWPIFAFTYMTAMAYVAAFVVYQVSVRLA